MLASRRRSPFVVVALALSLLSFAQDPAPVAKVDWAALAGAADDRAARDLATAIERDYAAAFAACQAMANGAAKARLGQALGMPAATAATIVLRGKLVAADLDQAGVVDLHTLRLTFADLQVLRAPADQRAELERGRDLVVLRGSSADAWLAQLLRRDLLQHADARVFCFAPRALRHPAAAGQTERALEVLEYEVLPAAAADCLPSLLGK